MHVYFILNSTIIFQIVNILEISWLFIQRKVFSDAATREKESISGRKL